MYTQRIERIVGEHPRRISAGKSSRFVGPLTGGAPAGASAWSVGGVFAARALALVAGIAVARLTNPEGFGEFSLALSTTTLFATIGGAGFSAALARESARVSAIASDALPKFHRWGVLCALLVGSATACLLVVGARILSPILGWSDSFVSMLPWAAGLVAVGLGSTAHVAFLQGSEEFRQVAVYASVRGCAAAVLTGAGAVVGGVPGALAGMTLGEAVVLGVAIWPVHRMAARAAPATMPHVDWRSILGATYAGSMATTGAQWWLRASLVASADGWRQLAVFDAAARFANLVPFLTAALLPVHVPELTRRYLAGDSVGWRERLRRLSGMTAVQAVLVAGPLALAGDALLGLYGPAFAEGRVALRILTLAGIAAAFNLAWGQALVAAGRIRLRGLLDVVLGLLALVVALPLASWGGAMGTAVAWSVPLTLAAVVAGLLLLRITPGQAREGGG